jgi:glycosyltransferase involved in cell wall biosynthesis
VRIGLLTTSFPRFDGDVAGHFVLGFARALAALGHHIEVLAPEPGTAIPCPSWPNVDLHWVPYLRPQSAQRGFYGAGVPDNLLHDPLAWLGLAPFCAALASAVVARRSGWDAVISHFGLPCGWLAGELRGRLPHLAVMHSADVHLLARLPGRGAIARRIAAGADQLIFVTDAHRQRFLDCLPASARTDAGRRCHVQPMGITPPILVARERAVHRRELGLTRFTLLTLARLVPIKGLFEAISSVQQRTDIEWLIAGEGPEQERLLRLAAQCRFPVRLLGSVHGEQKQALLQAADAFVMPSRVLPSGRSEGMPTALIEAMASGLPAIASNVGGIAEVVRHRDTGLLLDPLDPGALARCLDQLRADPALAATLSTRGRAEALRHDWSTIAPGLDALLRARDASSSPAWGRPGWAKGG